jgi:hypothetical protein
MRPSHVAVLALCCGIAVCAFATEGPTPTVLARQASSPTPFEAKLDQIQALTARVRESGDPAERRRLLAEQARAVQEALWLTRIAARPAPGRPFVGPPAMVPQALWGPRDGIRRVSTPSPQRAPRQARTEGPARYQALERQIRDLEERVAAQQVILDEILKYREPIERLLGHQE